MDSNEVNKDVDEAEFSVDELRALVREQQPVIDELRWELKVAKGKINQLQERADRHPTERVAEEYSVDAGDQRRRGGGSSRSSPVAADERLRRRSGRLIVRRMCCARASTSKTRNCSGNGW